MIHTRNGAGKVYVQDDVYLAYQSLINSFNERLRTLLHELENDTNGNYSGQYYPLAYAQLLPSILTRVQKCELKRL